MKPTATIVGLAIATAACGGNPAPATAQVPDSAAVQPDTSGGLVQAGQGQLSQDVITITLNSGDLVIRFTPLDERVTRLLATDAYRSLHLMVGRNRATIDSLASSRGISDPGVVLVSFFALAPNTSFDPNLLTITSRNRLIRPQAFIPLSASFGAQRLDVRSSATAIFLYDRTIPVTEPFSIDYLDASSDAWENRLSRFDRERARIQAKSHSSGPSGDER